MKEREEIRKALIEANKRYVVPDKVVFILFNILFWSIVYKLVVAV